VNLIADIGNTRSKLAVFQKDVLLSNQLYSKLLGFEDFEQFIKKNKTIKNLIYSTVGKFDFEPSSLKISGQFIKLSHKTSLPIEILYSSKNTLGSDRIALAVGGSNKVNGKSVLIIDAGSCITFDFVNAKKQYLGGSISPGLNMRFKSLNTFTANLPLLTHNKLNKTKLIGKTTNDSIFSGIINGTISEVIGMVNKFQEKFSSFDIIITGGDYQVFEKALSTHPFSKKNMIFADPNLVLTGLNAILNFNVK